MKMKDLGRKRKNVPSEKIHFFGVPFGSCECAGEGKRANLKRRHLPEAHTTLQLECRQRYAVVADDSIPSVAMF
jgi:hypothetical protein